MRKEGKMMIRCILATMLCALISFAFMPIEPYALDEQNQEADFDELVLVEVEEISITPTEPVEDPDTLLEGYMDSRIDEELSASKPKSGMRKAATAKRRNNLNDKEKVIYDGIKLMADRVASGQQGTSITKFNASSVFEGCYVRKGNYYAMTSESLGISSPVLVANGSSWSFSEEAANKLNSLYSFRAIFNALLADEPYAFYWFDKTIGACCSPDGGGPANVTGTSDFYFNGEPSVKASFTVSVNYRPENGEKYDVDTGKTGATASAVQNALDIITDKTAGSDYERLLDYKDSICAYTDYDRAAASGSNTPYGDPWQMIYVFDGDPETKVVCEGYAKAFQYLCDHTDFDRNVECDTVTGDMTYRTKTEPHMWNILHMEDGKNYLADVTNSDSGTVGEHGGLFISPAMNGDADTGYNFDTNSDGSADVLYVYDDSTQKTFLTSELSISGDEYDAPDIIKDAAYTWASDGSSCTASGTAGGNPIQETASIEKNSVTSNVTKEPTCTDNGVTTYTARFDERGFRTQRKAIADIPSLGGHIWNGGAQTIAPTEHAAGVRTYTCTRCGATRTEGILAIVYPTDLPTVKISKPKAGKKKVTVKWKKVSKKNQKKIQGIEIQVATDAAFNNIIRTAYAGKRKTSKSITGLQSKATYYVRIRAYNDAGGRHVSVWKSKGVKVK